MSDADVEELLELPPEERLRLVELLWGNLTAIPSATLPHWLEPAKCWYLVR
jgi:hypothetical protein